MSCAGNPAERPWEEDAAGLDEAEPLFSLQRGGAAQPGDAGTASGGDGEALFAGFKVSPLGHGQPAAGAMRRFDTGGQLDWLRGSGGAPTAGNDGMQLHGTNSGGQRGSFLDQLRASDDAAGGGWRPGGGALPWAGGARQQGLPGVRRVHGGGGGLSPSLDHVDTQLGWPF